MKKQKLKVLRSILAAAIFAVVICACAIPVFAFGKDVPDANFVYYKYWQLGGNQKYTEVKQCTISSTGVMTPGSATNIQTLHKKLALTSSIKFDISKNIPSTAPTPSNVTVKEKLMYNNFAFSWIPVTFKDNITEHKVAEDFALKGAYKGATTYDAPTITTLSAQSDGNYQIDLVVTENIPVYYQSYVTLWYESGIDRA